MYKYSCNADFVGKYGERKYNKMNVQLDPITLKGKRAFAQLINLYNFNYDFTNYLNDEIPEDGFFCGDADYFMNDARSHNFFIRVDGKIAGYVIISDGGCRYLEDETAHNIDEFFVTRKYRRKGIGRIAATTAFDLYKGKWEVCQMQDNVSAQQFWLSVISEYTNNDFQRCGSPDDEMVGFIFDNSASK